MASTDSNHDSNHDSSNDDQDRAEAQPDQWEPPRALQDWTDWRVQAEAVVADDPVMQDWTLIPLPRFRHDVTDNADDDDDDDEERPWVEPVDLYYWRDRTITVRRHQRRWFVRHQCSTCQAWITIEIERWPEDYSVWCIADFVRRYLSREHHRMHRPPFGTYYASLRRHASIQWSQRLMVGRPRYVMRCRYCGEWCITDGHRVMHMCFHE